MDNPEIRRKGQMLLALSAMLGAYAQGDAERNRADYEPFSHPNDLPPMNFAGGLDYYNDSLDSVHPRGRRNRSGGNQQYIDYGKKKKRNKSQGAARRKNRK